jgi:hypothetical protein
VVRIELLFSGLTVGGCLWDKVIELGNTSEYHLVMVETVSQGSVPIRDISSTIKQ